MDTTTGLATQSQTPVLKLIKAPLAVGAAFWAVFIVRAADFGSGGSGYTLFDDAMVSMRYARNLADGNGLVWDTSQPPTEGFTNFLWTLWMAALHRIGLSGPAASLAVAITGAVLLGIAVWLTARLALVLAPDDTRVVRWSAWFAVGSYGLAYWALRGMEVGLVAVLLLASLLVLVSLPDRERSARGLIGLAVLACLASLTRPDAAVPIIGAALAVEIVGPVWRRGLRFGVVLGSAAVTTVVLTFLRVRWYGEVVPNTYTLKLGSIGLADRLPRGLMAGVASLSAVVLPVTLAVIAIWLTRGRQRALLLTFLTPCVVVLGYSAYVGGDVWEWANFANRYIAPTWPLLGVAAASGISTVVNAPADRRRKLIAIAAVIALVAAVLFAIGPTAHFVHGDEVDAARAGILVVVAVVLGAAWLRADDARCRALLGIAVLVGMLVWPIAGWLSGGGLHVPDDLEHARLGQNLREALPPNAAIAVAWAGSIPYYAERPALDELGKTDARIAAERPKFNEFVPGHNKWDLDTTVGHDRPAVVVELPNFSDWNAGVDQLRSYGYVLLPTDGRHLVFVDPKQADPKRVLQAVQASGF